VVGSSTVSAVAISNSPRLHTPMMPTPRRRAQPGLGQGRADQLGPRDGGLGDLQTGELTDHVAAAVGPEGALGHRASEHVAEPQHLVGAGQLRMSIDASADAVATTGTVREISRTVKVMLVLVVSVRVAATSAAWSTRAARYVTGSSSSPTMTR
jgi:hypothetical protein